ncbi:Uncharacterised protein [uncultured archaeon]|nr:Uncharacterised protein [uncultured archaeon]
MVGNAQRSMRFGLVLAALPLLALLLASFLMPGCVTSVAPADKFSSDLSNPVIYNFSQYVTAQVRDPTIDPQASCTAMVCSQDAPSRLGSFFRTLFGGNWVESTLNNSRCQFIRINTSAYGGLIEVAASTGGINCNLTDPLSGKKDERACMPRFFMLGQGSDASAYSRAQMYCNTQLKMPVTWAVPNATTGKLDKNVSSPRLACYLQRDQMPAVIWYSGGRYIDTAEYAKMVQSFNTPKGPSPLAGPVMVSTEAFLDPTMADPNGQSGARLLNFSALDGVANQLRTIKQDCPQCLSVLALKPVFDNDSRPDLCALDYLLNSNTNTPRPAGCLAEYGSQTGRFATRQDLWKYTDLVGVGFIANDETRLPSCSLEGEVGLYLSYSRAALRQFYKPSVWYAVGMAAGPTASPDCPNATDSDVTNAYDALVSYVPALVSSGIVGVAPYRFGDDPAGLPMRLSVEQWHFNTTLTSLDSIRNFKGGDTALTLNDSANPDAAVGVARYVPEQSDGTRAVFLGMDGNAYAARLGAGGTVEIYALASRFGFFNADGSAHPSAYTWFSGCEYYTSNRAPLFIANTTMDQVADGAHLTSPDSQFWADVSSVQTAGENETLFYGMDGRAYAARPDGPDIKVFERPITAEAPAQPLVWSANGRGGQCSAFETTKTYARVAVRTNDAGAAYSLTLSRNLEDRQRSALLSCGGGACLSSVPMPAAFCKLRDLVKRYDSYDFPPNACTDYPQMDIAFSEKGVDPVLMRAIAVRESGLGRTLPGGQSNVDSATPPSCAMGIKDSRCGRGDKDPSILLNSPSPPDSPRDKIQNWINLRHIDNSRTYACGLGIMQCLDAPGYTGSGSMVLDCGGASYNPFNPQQNACCGATVFQTNFDIYRKLLQDLWSAPNSQIRAGGVAYEELDWYAAWMSAYSYLGVPTRSYVQSYTASSGLSLPEYVVGQLNNTRSNKDEVIYGTRVILRYNQGLDVCGAGCPYQPCAGPQIA